MDFSVFIKDIEKQKTYSSRGNSSGTQFSVRKKTIENTNCCFEVALAWAISAKNTLHSVHGYSPNQLVFGKNPNLPAFLNDKLPALEGVSTSEVVADNLNAMHAARKQFIACESSEKLRRALHHQVRTGIAQAYKNGDAVLYKRNLCDRWLGPGTVIGWEHKQVLVKHGGTYVRVHPSRLAPYPETYRSSSKDSIKEPSASQNRLEESPDVPISEKFDMNGDLGTTNNNVEQHQTVEARDRPHKQDFTPKKIELPKPGQTIKCKLANDTDPEWKKLNVISMAGKATGKNKHLMNMVMEQGEPFWLDFEHGVSEWQTSEVEETKLV